MRYKKKPKTSVRKPRIPLPKKPPMIHRSAKTYNRAACPKIEQHD